jgi:hypothetical protein
MEETRKNSARGSLKRPTGPKTRENASQIIKSWHLGAMPRFDVPIKNALQL